MNIEKKRINAWRSIQNFVEHIVAKKLVIPKSEVYISESANKSQEIFDESRNSFDTIEGIKNSLFSLSDLNEMLCKRRSYVETHAGEFLNEFILFGCFLLDQLGQIWSIKTLNSDSIIFNNDVETYDTFKCNNASFTLTSSGFAIPIPDSTCPCCGKLLTIDDVKNKQCINIHGEFYHSLCYSQYHELTQITDFIDNTIDIVYNPSDYDYVVLSTSNLAKELFSPTLSILFHTIDGDIILSQTKKCISIEWQENFKPFDINKLFSNENVTKWEQVGKIGKRGIHAFGNNKVYEYLKKARDIVHPFYSKY